MLKISTDVKANIPIAFSHGLGQYAPLPDLSDELFDLFRLYQPRACDAFSLCCAKDSNVLASGLTFDLENSTEFSIKPERRKTY